MGCWVVPAVAAELWGIPLSQVLDCIRNGTLFWKCDDGFVLIDADPKGMELIRKAVPKDQRPPTFMPVLTPDELNALNETNPPHPVLSDDSANNSLFSNEDSSASEQYDWQIARRRAAQKRRSPIRR